MSLNEVEKKLLRQQAEAYAFIHDLRETARLAGTRWVLQRTEGIEEKIEKRRQEYPRLFQLYFGKALARAKKAQVTGVQGKAAPRRQTPVVKEKKVPRKRRHKRSKLE